MKKVRFSRSFLAIPYALFMAVFVVVPLFFILYYSLRDDVTGKLTFGNFIAFFTTPVNLRVAVRSFFIAFLSTIACLIIAYPVAYIVARSNLKNKSALLLIFIVPMWVNFVLRINALKELLDLMGLINKSSGWDIFNTVLGMVYDFLPFMILPIYTTILKIDKSYLEAARDLGANEAKTFLSVTLPLSKAGILSGVSMVFLPSMTNYVVSNWMTNNKVTIIGGFIDFAFLNDSWGRGSVTAIILLLLMFLFTWLTGGFKNDNGATKGKALW